MVLVPQWKSGLTFETRRYMMVFHMLYGNWEGRYLSQRKQHSEFGENMLIT